MNVTDPKSVYAFKPEFFDGALFDLRILSHREFMSIESSLGVGGGLVRTGWQKILATRFGLVGWEGVVDHVGSVVDFFTGRDGYVDFSLLDRLPFTAVSVIAQEIMRNSRLSEEQSRSLRLGCHLDSFADFDCQSCELLPAHIRQMRGCESPAPCPVFNLNGEDYFRCPWKVVLPLTYECLGAYQFYKDGILPTSGGLYDQSAMFVQSMLVLKSEFADRQAKMSKRGRHGT